MSEYNDYTPLDDDVLDDVDDEPEEEPNFDGYLMHGKASVGTRHLLEQRAREYNVNVDMLPEPFVNDLIKLFEDERPRLNATTQERAALAKNLLRANAFVLRNITSGDSVFTSEAVLQFIKTFIQNVDQQTLDGLSDQVKGDEQQEGDQQDGEQDGEGGSDGDSSGEQSSEDGGENQSSGGDRSGDREDGNESGDSGDSDADKQNGDDDSESGQGNGAENSEDAGDGDSQESSSGDSSPVEQQGDGCGKGDTPESGHDQPAKDPQKEFQKRMKSAMQKAWNQTEKRINRLNSFKEFGLTSEEAVDLARASDLSDNVVLNNDSLTSFVNRLLQKIKAGLHGKPKAETRGFTDADPEIIDFMNPETLLHPYLLPDACVVNEFPRLSIDVYIDYSGSMGASMLAVNDETKTFVKLTRFELAKLVAAKLIDMGVVNDIHFFDSSVSHNFTITAATKYKLYKNKAKPYGNTSIDNAIWHHRDKHSVCLIITDGDDSIYEWSDNCFFFFVDSSSSQGYFLEEFDKTELVETDNKQTQYYNKKGALKGNKYVRNNMAAAYVGGKILFSKAEYLKLDSRTPEQKRGFMKRHGYDVPFAPDFQNEYSLVNAGYTLTTKSAPRNDIDVEKHRVTRRRRRRYYP